MKDKLTRKWFYRSKWINKRLRVIRRVWKLDRIAPGFNLNKWESESNRLFKHNLVCSCYMCKECRKQGKQPLIEKIYEDELGECYEV